MWLVCQYCDFVIHFHLHGSPTPRWANIIVAPNSQVKNHIPSIRYDFCYWNLAEVEFPCFSAALSCDSFPSSYSGFSSTLLIVAVVDVFLRFKRGQWKLHNSSQRLLKSRNTFEFHKMTKMSIIRQHQGTIYFPHFILFVLVKKRYMCPY
jgi:hypothetical protein